MEGTAREEAARLIAECKLGVLSTTGEGGSPQSAVMGVAVGPALEVIFDTVKSSRKYGNLTTRPQCSFAFWIGERTVQYEGRAEELSGADLERYQQIYFAAFPDGPLRLSWPGIVYFVVKPAWLRYSDFNAEPRLIEEVSF